MLTDALAFASLAAAGSLHCAGMCGGFALVAAGEDERSLSGRSLRLALYAIGKAMSYAVLGVTLAVVVDGALGHDATNADTMHGVRRALAWVAGGAVVLAGLSAMGLRLPHRIVPRSLSRWVAPVWQSLLTLPPRTRSFSIGVATGLLPCGLSWSALALATQVPPATAAIGLFAFGLATGPVLFAVGLAGGMARARLQPMSAWLPWILGPALIGLGLLTAYRGGLPSTPADPSPCCSAGPTAYAP